MFTFSAEFFLRLRPDHLDDASLYDVWKIALDEPVDHTGAAHKADLPDGERKRRPFYIVVQFAAGHKLLKAVGSLELLLQLLLIESLAHEGRDLQGVSWKRIPVLRQV